MVRWIRVPGYPGYHSLFAPLVALERQRGKAYTGTRDTILIGSPFGV